MGTSVQLPRGRVFDNVSVQFPIISPEKRGLKRRLFFLSFVHAKDRKINSSLSAPVADLVLSRISKHGPVRYLRLSPRANGLHYVLSTTDFQRGGRLNSELSLGGTPYNGIYGEAPPEMSTFFRFPVYERVGIS